MGQSPSKPYQHGMILPDNVDFNTHEFIYCWIKGDSIRGKKVEFDFNFRLYCRSNTDHGIPFHLKFETLHKLLQNVYGNNMYFAADKFPSASIDRNQSLTKEMKLMQELMTIDDNIKYNHEETYICKGPRRLHWYSNEYVEATNHDLNAMSNILCKLLNSPNLVIENMYDMFKSLNIPNEAQEEIQREARELLHTLKNNKINNNAELLSLRNMMFEQMYVVSYADNTEWALKFEGKEYLLTIEWINNNNEIIKTVERNTCIGQRIFWFSSKNDKTQCITQRWHKLFSLSINNTELKQQQISGECIGKLIKEWTKEFKIYENAESNSQQFVSDILSIFSIEGAKYLVDKMDNIPSNIAINPFLLIWDERNAENRLERVREKLLDTFKKYQYEQQIELHPMISKGSSTIFQSLHQSLPTDYQCLKQPKEEILEEKDECISTDNMRGISKVLVVLICIEIYDGNKYTDLTLSELNEKNMIQLFVDRYNYDLIKLRDKRCSLKDYNAIIRKARNTFSDNKYECIIMVYSGHGTNDKLILSDYDNENKTNYDIDRKEVESCFDGDQLKDKISCYKIFFFDACRGDEHANCIEIKEENICCDDDINKVQTKGTKNKEMKNILHPDANRIIFYSNTANYAAYDEKNSGGTLLSALYTVMMNEGNYDDNFSDIEDKMRDETDHRKVKLLNNKDTSIVIEKKTVMKNKEMRKMCFKRNTIKKNEIIISLKNKINDIEMENVNVCFM